MVSVQGQVLICLKSKKMATGLILMMLIRKKLLVKVMQVVPIIGCLGSHKQVVVVENLEIQV